MSAFHDKYFHLFQKLPDVGQWLNEELDNLSELLDDDQLLWIAQTSDDVNHTGQTNKKFFYAHLGTNLRNVQEIQRYVSSEPMNPDSNQVQFGVMPLDIVCKVDLKNTPEASNILKERFNEAMNYIFDKKQSCETQRNCLILMGVHFPPLLLNHLLKHIVDISKMPWYIINGVRGIMVSNVKFRLYCTE